MASYKTLSFMGESDHEAEFREGVKVFVEKRRPNFIRKE